MNNKQVLKGDLNNNGSIDNTKEARTNIVLNAHDINKIQSELTKLKRMVNVDVVSKNNEYASSAKIAEELTDGKQRIYFNNISKSVVFKNANKPMTSCLQIVSNDNSIKNVSHIHFINNYNNSMLMGLIDNHTTEITAEEASHYVPTLNYVSNWIDPSLDVIGANLIELNNKTHDINYDETNSTTTIANDLQIGGGIDCTWLDNEFAKYALVGHNHDSTYSQLNHNHDSTYSQLNHNHDSKYANILHSHEFADIYKTITKTIVNENTNEEEEVTETKTLQQVLTEYEQSMNTIAAELRQSINGKANSSHTHEISDIYKTVTDPNDNTTTTKSLETLLNEREAALQSLINAKANTSHTHNATEIIYKPAEGNDAAVNVKQQLDKINQQLEYVDDQGNAIDLLKILFGVGAGVSTAIDGGLIYAVITLQGEVATLQSQIVGEGLADDAFEAFDEVGDVAGRSSNLISGLSSWANCFSRIRASLRGYQQVATVTANPLSGAVIL